MAKIFNDIYKVFTITVLILMGFGLFLQTPAQLLEGLLIIFRAPNILVTDYIEIAGLGPALVNAGILSLASVGMLLFFKHEPQSGTIGGLWLLVGFALFGKNILNVIPIYLGGFLYARFRKQPFSNSIMTILVASSLAPAVSQKLFIDLDIIVLTGLESIGVAGSFAEPLSIASGYVAAVGMGIAIGFVFEPLASNIKKAHDGFNLYNGGLTAGIIAIFITATLGSFNIFYQLNDEWSSGNNPLIFLITIVISLWLLFVGLYMNWRQLGLRGIWERLREINHTKADYYPEFGTFCYINMGLLGLFCILVSAIFSIELSALAFGAIITIIGFGANGKNIPSGAALMLGVAVGTFFSPMEFHDPGIIAAFFFVLSLCPIPSKFGLHWGVIAGILHIHLVTSLAVPSGGINLYNNGLAAGFVAILLVPVILAFKARATTIEEAKAAIKSGRN